jgi:hypothetical protein
MPFYINSSDPAYLYLGTDYSILRVDKATGEKRTIAGNLSEGSVFRWRGYIEFPWDLQLQDGYLYAGNDNGRVIRVYTGQDSFGAVEQFLPHLPGVNNLAWIAGNSATLFYNGDHGIYAKDYATLTDPVLLVPLESWYNAIPTDLAIFIISDPPALLKFDLATKQTSTIQSNLTLQVGSISLAPMTQYGKTIYWMDGKSIYGMNVDTGSPHLVSTINSVDTLPQIAADDQYVYVRPTSLYVIYKVSVTSGTVTEIPLPLGAHSIAVANGTLYYSTGVFELQINSVSETGQISTIFDSTGTDLDAVRDAELLSTDGKLFLRTGYKVLIYDLTTNTYEIIFPLVYTDYFYTKSGELFVGSAAFIQRVLSIPIEQNIRPIDELFPATPLDATVSYSVASTTIDQDRIYWISVGYSAGLPVYYRISSAALDGSNYQQLFESTSELRDLAIRNGEIYFTCYDQCGSQGWVLASMPVTGGTPTPVFGLLADPKTFYRKGIFYVADTSDFIERQLFTINLDLNDASLLLSRLYYDNQFSHDVFVDISSQWLYVAQQKIVQNGPPARKLSRYMFNSWNSIGQEQRIIDNSIANVDNLIITTITTDGNYLYYWHDGIQRVRE